MITLASSRRAAGTKALAVVALTLALLTGCTRQATEPQMLPAQVLGEWRTNEPRYEGRFLKLDSDQVTIGLGGEAPDQREHIQTVSLTPPDSPTDYVIGLRTSDGAEDSIALQFSPRNGGELRLKSQPKILWRRQWTSENPDEMPRQSTRPSGRYIGHQTIYKIDCIQPPTVCHSY
jgi:hypothetical protein